MSTKQPYTIKQLISGLDVSQDPLYIADGSSPYLQNCWMHEGLLKKGLAFSAFGNNLPLDAALMLIDSLPIYTGAIEYLFATLLSVFKYSTATGIYSSIMAAGSSVITTKVGPASWSNGSPGFNTFSSTGADIAAAQNTAGSSESCSAASMTLVSGKVYRITLWAVISSGQLPTLSGTNGVPSTVLYNGRNDIVFTASGTSSVLTITNTSASSWSIKKVGAYLVGNVAQFTGDLDNQFSGVPIIDAVRYENGALAGGVDQYIFTNGKDNMQKWDGGASSKLTDLRGWSDNSIVAKQISYFNEMLIGTPTVEGGMLNPKRVRWTAVGDVEDVLDGGTVELIDTSDWCVAPFSLQGNLFIMKERSIWQLQWNPNTLSFTPVCIVDGVGCDTPNGIINLGQEIMFYGSDNIYVFDGLNVTPIGQRIYPWLYEAQQKVITGSFNNRCPATYIEELKQFVICLVPTQGQIPNQYFTYSMDNESWVLRTQEVTAFGFYTIPTATPWDELVGNWLAQTWQWMSLALPPGAPITLIGDSNGNVYQDNRLTYDNSYMVFQTKDFMFEHATRWTEFRLKAKNGAFQASYSTDAGLSWSAPQAFAKQINWTEYVLRVNLTSQKVRLKIECTDKDLWIEWIELWYITRQRSSVLQSS